MQSPQVRGKTTGSVGGVGPALTSGGAGVGGGGVGADVRGTKVAQVGDAVHTLEQKP